MTPAAGEPVIAKAPGFGPFGPGPLPFPFSSPRCLLTENGRTAIWAGLTALALPAGARVLVPAWHCGSEIDAILAAGAVPVPYRLRQDLSADLDHLAELLNVGAAAIYLIHYFGKPQPVAQIAEMARGSGAVVIEDLALGLLSCDEQGVPLGQAGDMSVFSLVKTLAVPDGGALWLRDRVAQVGLGPPPLRRTFGALRSIWQNPRRGRARNRNAGQGSAELDAWTGEGGFAALGSRHRASAVTGWLIRHLDHDRIRSDRRRNWAALVAALPHGGVAPLIGDLPPGACPAFFPLWAEDPDRVMAALFAGNIEGVRFWRRFHPAVDLTPFPEVQRFKRHVLRLPIHSGIDQRAIDRIALACRMAT
ncbi:MAG: DegT/DnrJ/EryC1/StrS family aminotransferase [Paracoccaceae bacterium]